MSKIRAILAGIVMKTVELSEMLSAFAFVILGAVFVLVGVYSVAVPAAQLTLALPWLIGPAALIVVILVANGARLFWKAIESDMADTFVDMMIVHLTGAFAVGVRIVQWLFRKKGE
jgi:hypothetical protein